ncbi:MAG: hypothetical protein WB507_05100 [Solirubrobacterales bacterium]
MILFEANWEPPGGGGAVGGGGDGGGQQAPLTLAKPTVPVRDDDALLELLCHQAAQCSGLAQLQNEETAPARERALARAKRAVTYASAAFKIGAGKKGIVKVPLRVAGRQLLKRRRTAMVWLNVSLDKSTEVPSVQVTLRK